MSTFPTVDLVTGQTTTLRRDAQPDTNPVLDLRYVFHADGTFRHEGFAPPDTSTVSVYESGRWETNGDQLLLTQHPEPLGTPTRLTYALAGDRLVLSKLISDCQGRSDTDCLDRANASLALPPAR